MANNNQQTNEKKHNYFYKITNLINQKYYYGIRSTNKHPLKDSYMGSGKLIKRSIDFFGIENFLKEIIADYPTRKEVSDHEKLVVTMELVLDENCYNLRCGGDNESFKIMSEPQKKLIGDANRGKIRSEEFKKRISETHSGKNHCNYGKHLSESTRRKISESNKGKKHTEETKKHLSKVKSGKNSYWFGKHLTDEHKKKISDSNKGKIITQEQKDAISRANKGKKITKEQRLKRSIYQKTRVRNKHTITSKNKMRSSSYKNKSCTIDGVEFISISEASRVLNLPWHVVSLRIKSNKCEFQNWNFK